MNVRDPLKIYLPIAQAIGALLQPHSEVVIHDLETHKIAAIYNPSSNRAPGDDSLLEDNLAQEQLPDFFPPYTKGQSLRSVTATLRNEKGRAEGLLCINLNFSPLRQANKIIEQFLTPLQSPPTKPKELFANDWRDRIDTFLEEYLDGRETALLTYPEKRLLFEKLYQAGAHSAKNAPTYVAQALNIARSTVYRYLKEMSS